MAGSGTEFEPVNLGNVGEGELERQFAECIHQVIAAFEEPHEYEPSGRSIKAKVKLDVEFSLHLETGAVLVGVRANFVPPKRRAALRAAFIKDGVVLVEDVEQLQLLDAGDNNVTPISAAGVTVEENGE